jgi:hypothetical protein
LNSIESCSGVNGNLSIVGGGEFNCICQDARYSFIGSGKVNCATGVFSSVVGGCGNKATGYASFVSGGFANCATGGCSSAFGGTQVCATGVGSVAMGACQVSATATNAIAFGSWNTSASGAQSTAIGFWAGASGQRSVVVSGWNNTASGYGSTSVGGQQNCATGSGASTIGGNKNANGGGFNSIIAGGTCNCVTNGNGGSNVILGGECNLANAFVGSTILNGQGGLSTMTKQLVTNAGLGTAFNGTFQNSIVLPYASRTYTSGATGVLGLAGGTYLSASLEYILPTGNNRSWQVRISYTAVVTAISGTATGVSVGDTKTQTQEVGVRKVGGITSILTGSPNNGIALEDASMNTAQMNYSVGAGQDLLPTFLAPTFAGGGTLTISITMTMILTEVAW